MSLVAAVAYNAAFVLVVYIFSMWRIDRLRSDLKQSEIRAKLRMDMLEKEVLDLKMLSMRRFAYGKKAFDGSDLAEAPELEKEPS